MAQRQAQRGRGATVSLPPSMHQLEYYWLPDVCLSNCSPAPCCDFDRCQRKKSSLSTSQSSSAASNSPRLPASYRFIHSRRGSNCFSSNSFSAKFLFLGATVMPHCFRPFSPARSRLCFPWSMMIVCERVSASQMGTISQCEFVPASLSDW